MSHGNRCGNYQAQAQNSRDIYRQAMEVKSSYLRFEQHMPNRSGIYATLGMEEHAWHQQKHRTFDPHTSLHFRDNLGVQEQGFSEGEYISNDMKARLNQYMGRKSYINSMADRKGNFRRRKRQTAVKSCTSPFLSNKFEFIEPTLKERNKHQSQRRNFRNQRRNFRAGISQKRGIFNPHRDNLRIQEHSFAEVEYISNDRKTRLNRYMGRKSYINSMADRKGNFRRRKRQNAVKSCKSPLLRDKSEFIESTFEERNKQQGQRRNFRYQRKNFRAGIGQKRGIFNPHRDNLTIQEHSFAEVEYISNDRKTRLNRYMGRKSYINSMADRKGNFRRRKRQNAVKSCKSPLLRDKSEFIESTFEERNKQQGQRRNFRYQRKNFRAGIGQKRGTSNPNTSPLLRDDLEVQDLNFNRQAQSTSSNSGSQKGNFATVIRKPQGNTAKSTFPASSTHVNKRDRRKDNNRWENIKDTIHDLVPRLKYLSLKNPFASVIGE